MHDPFEESLRDLLRATPSGRDDDACLGRVLKTANRQVGAGALFGLMGNCLRAVTLGVSTGAAHITPVSRRKFSTTRPADKAD